MNEPNATFHSFKSSGKWYAIDRGYLSKAVFNVFDRRDRRALIVANNGNAYPGLSSNGSEFIFIVFGDEALDYGYPLMLFP